MTLGKPVKILVGVGTVWIILYPLLFLATWLSMMTGFISASSAEPPSFLFSLIPAIFPVHCLTLIVQLALMAFYLYHVIKNTTTSEVLRVVLGIGTFFIPYIAMPLYYYLCIWREQPPTWALAKETKPSLTVGSIAQHNISATQRPTGLSKRQFAIIAGMAGIVVFIFLFLGFILIRFVMNFNQTMQRTNLAEPTPITYEHLPIYGADEKPFYQPLESSSFIPVTVFKGISTWRDYNEIPILIVDDSIFVTGHIQEPKDSWGDINVDLVSADINTGKVRWQALAGSASLWRDSKYIYAVAANDYGPTGVVAYTVNTGNIDWKTRFQAGYAAGIDHINLTETELTAYTYEHGKYASYRDCSTSTGAQMLKSAFWGRLGRYEKDSSYSQSQTGAG